MSAIASGTDDVTTAPITSAAIATAIIGAFCTPRSSRM